MTFTMKYKDIQNILPLLTICLLALSPSKKTKQLCGSDIGKADICKFANTTHLASWLNNLYIVWNILNLTKNEKVKAAAILANYSSSYKHCKQAKKLATINYIRRFTYKHEKNHKYKFKTQTYNKKGLNINHTAITTLYTMYKVFKSNNSFLNVENLIRY